MKKVGEHFEEVICVILMAVLLALTFVNVIARYVLHASLSYTDEVTTGLFVYLTMFGTAVAAKRKANLGLSLITDRFKPEIRCKVLAVTFAICTALSVVLLWTGWGMVQNQIKHGQISAALELPEWLYGLAIPLGAVFMVIRFAEAAWKEWNAEKGGKKA